MAPPTALITGASKGFGYALAEALAQRGWRLLIGARTAADLLTAQRRLERWTEVEAISGDVRDEIYLLQFPERLTRRGWTLDLLVNNASTLGASPQPKLLEYSQEALHAIYHTNAIAPLSLLQKVRPQLAPEATIVNLSSDAAVEPYPGWGGYGASKAALDHWSAILAREEPRWRVWAFDPGDMRTELQQAAFPGEDISDRPLPAEVAAPALLQLLKSEAPSGRYVAARVLESIAI